MHRLRAVLLASAAVAGFGDLAAAADLNPWPVLKAPPVAAPSWTGFYTGLSVGGRWSDAGWATAAVEDGRGVGSTPFTATTRPDPSTASASFDASTFRVGGYYGYNWQIAPAWVIGTEGDIAWGNSSRTIAGLPGTYGPAVSPVQFANPATAGFDSTRVKESWDASSRVRAGYLVTPTLLLYATGGLAMQHVEVEANCSLAGPWCILGNHSQSDTWTKVGWTVGGGVEALLWGNWLARAEYRYADYGTLTGTAFANTGNSVTYDLRLRTHTALLGLAYKFNDSLFGSMASAIDAAPAAPAAIDKAPPAPTASWTGAYAGLSVGGRWADDDWTTTGVQFGGGVGAGVSTIPDPATASPSFHAASVQGGGYAGYLWQLSPHWVAGTEGDIAWGDSSKTITGIPGTYGPTVSPQAGVNPATAVFDSATVKEGWDSTLLTRVGYLVTPDVLLYGTGGTALQRITLTANCSAAGPWCSFDAINRSQSSSVDKLGWTLGAGVEATVLGSWRVRAEYRYADFGTVTQTFFANSVDSLTADVKVRTHTGLIGLAYAFGS